MSNGAKILAIVCTIILAACAKDAIVDNTVTQKSVQTVETPTKASKPPAPKEPTILASCADADFDGDGTITAEDMNKLVEKLDNNNGGEPKYAGTEYDMNKDGTVDYSDVSFFGKCMTDSRGGHDGERDPDNLPTPPENDEETETGTENTETGNTNTNDNQNQQNDPKNDPNQQGQNQTRNVPQPPPPQAVLVPPPQNNNPPPIAQAQTEQAVNGLAGIIYVGDDNTQKSISITEGDDIVIKFEISQSQTEPTDLTVNWGQTTTAETKFGITVPSTTVTIPAMETATTVTIPTVSDDTVEGNATLTVTLEKEEHYNVDETNSVTVTIKDNDVVTIRAIPGLVYEGQSTTVTFSVPTEQNNDVVLNVNWDSFTDDNGEPERAADTYRINVPQPTVTIPAMQTSTTVTIQVMEDNVVTEDRRFDITLAPGDYVYNNVREHFTVQSNDAIVNLDVNKDYIEAGGGDILEATFSINIGGANTVFTPWAKPQIGLEFKTVSEQDTTYIYKNRDFVFVNENVRTETVRTTSSRTSTYSHDANWECGDPPVDCGDLKRLYISMFFDGFDTERSSGDTYGNL